MAAPTALIPDDEVQDMAHGRRVNRILCAANPRGSAAVLQQLVSTADEHDADAIAVVGNLGDHQGRRDGLHALAEARIPVYWVPGPEDAPMAVYLRDAFGIETAFPLLRSVHGTAASGPGNVVFAGFGGEISDDPEARREEHAALRYPRWEPEYRLKLLAELDYNELVLMFNTPPAHRGESRAGSDVVAELVNTHRPRLVVSGGEPGVGMLGRAVTVAPGDLGDGHYAVADLRRRHAEIHELAVAVR
jgi:hypothetical protein